MCYHRDKRFESKCIAIAQHEGNEREKNAGELMRGKIDFFSFFNSNIYIFSCKKCMEMGDARDVMSFHDGEMKGRELKGQEDVSWRDHHA